MEERALKYFEEAFATISSGNFLDDASNQAFEYSLKSLLKTKYRHKVISDIVSKLPELFEKSLLSENPPPFIYVLLSTKEEDFIHKLCQMSLAYFVKNNANETSTFNLLNMIDTMSEKNIPIDNFVHSIIKLIRPDMDATMVDALAGMITVNRPAFIGSFVKKFLDIAKYDKTFLVNFLRSGGKKAFLEATKIATPAEMNFILKLMKS